METSAGKRALVTGITGQDGSYLAEQLIDKGYEVFGLVRRLSSPNTKNIVHLLDRIQLVDGDLLDQASLDHAVRVAEPNEIYHLAAQSFVAASFSQPVLTGEVTALGALRLLEAQRRHADKAHFYQASSSEMFGRVSRTPQDETTEFHPRSPYGVAKVYAYWAAVNYRESYGLYVANGICYNHESPRRGHEFVTRKITDGVARIHLGLAKQIRLGTLSTRRDWGYAPEYTDFFWRSLQAPTPDDYVAATGEDHSVEEFVAAAFHAVGIEDWRPYVELDRRYARPAEVDHLCGNASKARTQLGWEPKVRFPELVRIMVESDIQLLKGTPVAGRPSGSAAPSTSSA
jgi:GDPmannose 4,6-dehydratase